MAPPPRWFIVSPTHPDRATAGQLLATATAQIPAVHGNRLQRRLATMAIAFAIAGLQLALPTPAAAADGLTESATTTYTLNPAAGRLDVAIDVSVRNSKANTTTYEPCTKYVYDPSIGYYPVPGTCPQTTRYYVTETYLWLEDEAIGFKVTADAGTPKLTLYKRGDGFNQYRIVFKAAYNGQTRSLHLRYQIPSGAPRSSSPTRVGMAYASFCVAANGYDAGTTRVIVPAAFTMSTDVHNGSFTTSTTDGLTTYKSGVLTDTSTFWACLDGNDANAYAKSSIASPSGRSIELQAWPEDPVWNEDVRSQIGDALGALESLIGRPLPGSGTIVVREVSAGELGAYAGTFDPEIGIARVSEDLEQPGVVAHELSHSWFNDALFNARWLSEGSAGWAESTITGVRCADPGAPPGATGANLPDWTFAGPKATEEELDRISYEYAASCFIVASVATRIGHDRMHDVLGALLDHKVAYRSGNLALEGRAGAQDWRNWLDAVDELGLVPAGSADLDYAQVLLTRFGIAADATTLAARSEARSAYHALARSIADWSFPAAILRPMGEWRFADATIAMDLEATAFSAVGSVTAALPDVDAVNGPVRELVEQAETIGDLRAAAQQAADQLAAADAVAAARVRLEAPHDFLAQVGLLGTDLRPALVAGIAAVTAIDLGVAQNQADLIERTLADAPNQGLFRVGIGVVIIVLIAIALFLIRRRRRSRALFAAAASSSDGPSGPSDEAFRESTGAGEASELVEEITSPEEGPASGS